ncbi:hypothetical protein, partial [uncultured Parabacteroides sp.]|uniref:hypothetical protein n=1 Tax=uncultured Parabacteroides sp. TaxID=512312 RepID=UPI0025E462DB
IKENSHTPCPLSRGEGVTIGRYKQTVQSPFTGSALLIIGILAHSLIGSLFFRDEPSCILCS